MEKINKIEVIINKLKNIYLNHDLIRMHAMNLSSMDLWATTEGEHILATSQHVQILVQQIIKELEEIKGEQ